MKINYKPSLVLDKYTQEEQRYIYSVIDLLYITGHGLTEQEAGTKEKFTAWCAKQVKLYRQKNKK